MRVCTLYYTYAWFVAIYYYMWKQQYIFHLVRHPHSSLWRDSNSGPSTPNNFKEPFFGCNISMRRRHRFSARNWRINIFSFYQFWKKKFYCCVIRNYCVTLFDLLPIKKQIPQLFPERESEKERERQRETERQRDRERERKKNVKYTINKTVLQLVSRPGQQIQHNITQHKRT